MMNLSRWKIGLVLLAVLLGTLFTVPNFLSPAMRDQVKSFMPTQILNLGLDLQGGSYLLMEVDTDALVKEKATNLTEDVRNSLKTLGISYTSLGASGSTVAVTLTDPSRMTDALSSLSKMATPLPNKPGVMDIAVVKSGPQSITLTLTPEGIRETASRAVDTSITIVRRRIDNLGTKEPSIVRQGSNRIVVEAPGESDPEQLKHIIGQTAKMTFQMVDETVSESDMLAGRVPPGSEILPDDERPGSGAQLVVRKAVLVSGSGLT